MILAGFCYITPSKDSEAMAVASAGQENDENIIFRSSLGRGVEILARKLAKNLKLFFGHFWPKKLICWENYCS